MEAVAAVVVVVAAAAGSPEVVLVVTEAPWPLVLVVVVQPRGRRPVVVDGENGGGHHHCYCWYHLYFVFVALVVVVPHFDQYQHQRRPHYLHRHDDGDDYDHHDAVGSIRVDTFPTAVGGALVRPRRRRPTCQVLPFHARVVANSPRPSGSVVVDFVDFAVVAFVAAFAVAAFVAVGVEVVIAPVALRFRFAIPPPPWHDTIA
jgi:hypothetical protein